MKGAEAKAKFRGCFTATLTPFNDAGRLDLGVVRAHTAWLVESGIEGLCPAGTTGEFLYLTTEEKRALVRATVEGAAGRATVVAGVWGLRPEETALLAKSAEEVGADGLFLPTPIYYPASDDVMFAHYAHVAQASSLPLFAYNIPQYAANEVSLACLKRLFEAGIIVGAKDSSGKAERFQEQVALFGANGAVFAASDSFATKGRQLGADGFISAIANLEPSLFARLWAGDESLQTEVDALRNALKSFGSIPALKFLLSRMGVPFGESRLPFSTLSFQQRDALLRLK
jgi:4-hydroxy-tetrahydrodipicolinate synthase